MIPPVLARAFRLQACLGAVYNAPGMNRLDFILWQGAPDHALVDALAAAAGMDDVVVLTTWNGCVKGSWDFPATPEATGAVNLEWLDLGTGAAMAIEVFGSAIGPGLGRPEFGRRLARALGRPLLFGDCHLFPWTYMMAREDGAIVHVVVQPGDEAGFVLLPEDPSHPDHWERDVLFGPDDPLPVTTAETLASRLSPPGHCAIFGGACPKRKFRCVDPRG
jgi:hypothetical protein